MPPKIIKLAKKDDIAAAIKQIKGLHDREVIFELEKGSVVLATSDNLKLLRRVGEALGKSIKVKTDDDVGRILAKKAGVLFGEAEQPGKLQRPSLMRVARSDVKPRFSDILGAKRGLTKVTEGIKKVLPLSNIEPAVKSSVSFSAKRDSSFKKSRYFFSNIFIILFVVLVLGVVGMAIFLPSVTITITARSEQLSRDLEITVDKSFSNVDSNKLQVPGIPVTREVSETKNFPATGINLNGTKAAGRVTIYNFTSNILTLKAATTTLNANGKKYFFTKDVTGIKPNGLANPDIQVIAEQPGESYNLAANTKFQIINSALGSANVYGLNSSGIGGGKATSTTVLSQEDLDKAVDSLTNAIVVQAASDLSQQNGAKVELVSSGISKEILAKTANKNVGDVTNSFDMTMIAKVTGLAFKDSDATGVVLAKINEVLSSDKYLESDAKSQYRAQFKSIDIPNGHGVLAMHFETIVAYKVDASNLTKILAGKNETEIKEILLSKPEIDKVQVKFWPDWFIHKAPRFNGKIYINTVLLQSN